MTAAASTPGSSPHRTDDRWTDDVLRTDAGDPVALIARTRHGGWTVGGACTQGVMGHLVEAMCLADLLAEDAGLAPHPAAAPHRRAQAEPVEGDETAQQLARLRRTIEQLEHALAARVNTERAIGVLAERQSLSPRAAFETLRTQARSSGRLVHDLAREVLDTLPSAAPTGTAPRPGAVVHELRPDAGVPPIAPSPAAPSDETAARSGPRRVTRVERRGSGADRRAPAADQPS